MTNKILSLVVIAESIKYATYECPIANAIFKMGATEDGSCFIQTCSKCIFNGLGQPDNTILENLFESIKNEF